MRSYSHRGASIVPNIQSFNADLSDAIFIHQVIDALERRRRLMSFHLAIDNEPHSRNACPEPA